MATGDNFYDYWLTQQVTTTAGGGGGGYAGAGGSGGSGGAGYTITTTGTSVGGISVGGAGQWITPTILQPGEQVLTPGQIQTLPNTIPYQLLPASWQPFIQSVTTMPVQKPRKPRRKRVAPQPPVPAGRRAIRLGGLA